MVRHDLCEHLCGCLSGCQGTILYIDDISVALVRNLLYTTIGQQNTHPVRGYLMASSTNSDIRKCACILVYTCDLPRDGIRFKFLSPIYMAELSAECVHLGKENSEH